ncbi:MAG: hypothetical protein BMS9Abin05_1184 [Rhodothermia bacterium]|nr:MAG: hypothetical protein BMS9Abin05_1184 [Rhodothermia bacterium]
MKRFNKAKQFIPLVLAALIAGTLMSGFDSRAELENRVCKALSDEIFFNLEAENSEVSITIKITNLNDDSSNSWTFSEGDPEISRCIADDIEWIASTDNADTGGENTGVNWMNPRIPYKWEIKEGSTVKQTFLYYQCTVGSEQNDPFYCPSLSGGVNNDITITYYRATDAIDFQPHGWDDTAKYNPVEETFSDQNWMLPYDAGTFCNLNGEKNTTCLGGKPGYFLSPQMNDGAPWTHTVDDLHIIGGFTWGLSVTIPKDSTFVFPSGSEVLVDAGGTLTIEEGVTFKFSHTADDITSYGTIDVNGTSGNKVNFIGNGASSWGSLVISGFYAESSDIDYAVFNDGGHCIYVYDANNVDVDNVTVEDCWISGVTYTNSSGGAITNITSTDNKRGLTIIDGDLRVEGTTVSGAELWGVEITDASTEFFDATDGPGDNSVINNDGDGFLATGAAIDMGDNSTNKGGDNSVHGNIDDHITARSSSDILAENNWWGESPPDANDFNIDGTSTMDYTPFRTSAPSKGGGGSVSRRDVSLASVLSGDADPGATGRFVRFVSKRRSQGGRNSSRLLLESIVRDKDHPQRSVATSNYIADLAHLGESYLATSIGAQYLSDESIQIRHKRSIARTLFEVYTRDVQSLSGASQMVTLLGLLGHSDVSSGFISQRYAAFVDSLGGVAPFSKDEPNFADVGGELDLNIVAYPNPFSESTRFRFSLDRPAEIELKIYDVLGREITTLVDRRLPEGVYHFTFSPGNLAPGAYFYRLRSGDYSKTSQVIYTR